MNVQTIIPAATPAIALPAALPARPPVIAVSVVEDDDWIRENLARQLDATPGFRCASRHRTAEEALEHLLAAAPDVILMDINLPRMSGIECLRQLKVRLPECNVLMLTVYEDSERIFDSLKAGANGYLLKRTPHVELIQAIEQVQQGAAPMSGLIARKVVEFFKQCPASSPEMESLTPREREILKHLGNGIAYKAIADALKLSVDTVRMHIRNIYRKLHVHSRGAAVAKFLQK